MESIIEVILQAGHSVIDLSLYTLLPIMIVMLIVMRGLEAYGILSWIVKLLSKISKPFGLNGFGVLAMIQISFISFAGPIPTLALMDRNGTSDRYLAATFATVLAMAPANALFPMAALGLPAGITLLYSLIGGLFAASSVYWCFGLKLSNVSHEICLDKTNLEKPAKSILDIINKGGAEAVRVIFNVIPMLLISLTVVVALQRMGAITFLQHFFLPAFQYLHLDPQLLLPTLTKLLAGGTALVSVVHSIAQTGQPYTNLISPAAAGFLLHPFDLPGLAIFLSAAPRLARLLGPSLLGAVFGLLVRVLLGAYF